MSNLGHRLENCLETVSEMFLDSRCSIFCTDAHARERARRPATRTGTSSKADSRQPISPRSASLPNERSAPFEAINNELYPMMVVDEQSATALPVSARAWA